MQTLSAGKKINLCDFDLSTLQATLAPWVGKTFHATQIYKWIHQHQVTDIHAMTNLSKALRERLTHAAEITLPTITYERISQDGTIKWLMQLSCGNHIETVFIPERTRGTLCISSQIGCALNCTFCATATQGFNRNLQISEIIGQLFVAKQRLAALNTPRKITNVVMMGMGEPLLNFDNVVKSINIMLCDNAYGLSKYRVTLSTSGLVPALQKFSTLSDASLAISLHAPNDQLRDELVPINKKYPLKLLLDTCRNYFEKGSRRHITMEYVMLDGVNDTINHAKALAKILKDIPCKINLIPFNPFPHTRYGCSSAQALESFQRYLMAKGLNTVVRKTRGDDINAACGQLVGNFKDRTKRSFRIHQQQNATQ